jgi:DNA-binding transcriptional ArsR family regulator
LKHERRPQTVARTRGGASANLAQAAPMFAALGDATRLRLVARLCDAGPQSTMRLARGAQVSRQAISKHLAVLEAAGLARGSRMGREHIWELQRRRLAEVQSFLNQISREWDAAIDRLRMFVENEPR